VGNLAGGVRAKASEGGYFPASQHIRATASIYALFITAGMGEPAGQFVCKIVAADETFFEFLRLY